jgi:hypothetical protein
MISKKFHEKFEKRHFKRLSRLPAVMSYRELRSMLCVDWFRWATSCWLCVLCLCILQTLWNEWRRWATIVWFRWTIFAHQTLNSLPTFSTGSSNGILFLCWALCMFVACTDGCYLSDTIPPQTCLTTSAQKHNVSISWSQLHKLW